MATKVYDKGTVNLIDGTELEIIPLKIKYLREFMTMFEFVKTASDDDEAMHFLAECAAIAMKQFHPLISTRMGVEDNMDMPNVYKLIDLAAGIKLNQERKEEETVAKDATAKGQTWEDLDLAKLESEIFLVGKWKDYAELELSMSMPEIIVTLGSKRDLDYEEKKFLAAIQGVDLDKDSGKTNAWEEMKARVFSGGKTGDPNDVVALQGANAAKAGFGIGMGLGYENVTASGSQPFGKNK